MKYYQQGDVLVKKINTIPEGVKSKENGKKGIVLAEGESTGHYHGIKDVSKAEFYEDENGKLYLRVKENCELTHQEHNTITIEKGDYTIGIVKEYDHFTQEAREVAD